MAPAPGLGWARRAASGVGTGPCRDRGQTRRRAGKGKADMSKAPLTFLAYLSRIRCAPEDITDLVAHAKVRNAATGLTGVLIHDSSHFLQFLEGPWVASADALLRIVGDPRHSEVTILVREPTEMRQFSNWDLERLEIAGASGPLADRMQALLSLPQADRATFLRRFALDLEAAGA